MNSIRRQRLRLESLENRIALSVSTPVTISFFDEPYLLNQESTIEINELAIQGRINEALDLLNATGGGKLPETSLTFDNDFSVVEAPTGWVNARELFLQKGDNINGVVVLDRIQFDSLYVSQLSRTDSLESSSHALVDPNGSSFDVVAKRITIEHPHVEVPSDNNFGNVGADTSNDLNTFVPAPVRGESYVTTTNPVVGITSSTSPIVDVTSMAPTIVKSGNNIEIDPVPLTSPPSDEITDDIGSDPVGGSSFENAPASANLISPEPSDESGSGVVFGTIDIATHHSVAGVQSRGSGLALGRELPAGQDQRSAVASEIAMARQHQLQLAVVSRLPAPIRTDDQARAIAPSEVEDNFVEVALVDTPTKMLFAESSPQAVDTFLMLLTLSGSNGIVETTIEPGLSNIESQQAAPTSSPQAHPADRPPIWQQAVDLILASAATGALIFHDRYAISDYRRQ